MIMEDAVALSANPDFSLKQLGKIMGGEKRDSWTGARSTLNNPHTTGDGPGPVFSNPRGRFMQLQTDTLPTVLRVGLPAAHDDGC